MDKWNEVKTQWISGMELWTEFEMMEFGLQEIKNGKHNKATSNEIPNMDTWRKGMMKWVTELV